MPARNSSSSPPIVQLSTVLMVSSSESGLGPLGGNGIAERGTLKSLESASRFATIERVQPVRSMKEPLGDGALEPERPRLQQDTRPEVVTVAGYSGLTMQETVIELSGGNGHLPLPGLEQQERCRKAVSSEMAFSGIEWTVYPSFRASVVLPARRCRELGKPNMRRYHRERPGDRPTWLRSGYPSKSAAGIAFAGRSGPRQWRCEGLAEHPFDRGTLQSLPVCSQTSVQVPALALGGRAAIAI